MARKNEAAELLIKGYSIPEIAKKMGISPISVKLYLCTVVGEGEIQRSDIFFSISSDKRKAIEEIIGNSKEYKTWEIQKILENKGYVICKEELDIFLMLREKDALLGDMYDYIRKIELTLHNMIKKNLIEVYKKNWWSEGIPLEIRKDCAARNEEEPERVEGGCLEPEEQKYSFTTFINLSTVIEKQWKIFSSVLPSELSSNRRQFLKDLNKINRIRNGVMHPVKKIKLSEADFDFIHNFQKKIINNKWKNISQKKIRDIIGA